MTDLADCERRAKSDRSLKTSKSCWSFTLQSKVTFVFNIYQFSSIDCSDFATILKALRKGVEYYSVSFGGKISFFRWSYPIFNIGRFHAICFFLRTTKLTGLFQNFVLQAVIICFIISYVLLMKSEEK